MVRVYSMEGHNWIQSVLRRITPRLNHRAVVITPCLLGKELVELMAHLRHHLAGNDSSWACSIGVAWLVSRPQQRVRKSLGGTKEVMPASAQGSLVRKELALRIWRRKCSRRTRASFVSVSGPGGPQSYRGR